MWINISCRISTFTIFWIFNCLNLRIHSKLFFLRPILECGKNKNFALHTKAAAGKCIQFPLLGLGFFAHFGDQTLRKTLTLGFGKSS